MSKFIVHCSDIKSIEHIIYTVASKIEKLYVIYIKKKTDETEN